MLLLLWKWTNPHLQAHRAINRTIKLCFSNYQPVARCEASQMQIGTLFQLHEVLHSCRTTKLSPGGVSSACDCWEEPGWSSGRFTQGHKPAQAENIMPKISEPSVPPLPAVMQSLPCLTREVQLSCLPLPPPDFHKSHLHALFIPTFECYDQHPYLIYQKNPPKNQQTFR